MTPPSVLAALLQAYIEVTGLPVSMSYERQRTLSEIHSRNIGPEDVRAVLDHLKNLIRTGAKGYADSSLDWRNSMANVDTLEERVLRLRQRQARKSPKPQTVVIERKVGADVIRSLGEQEPRNPQLIGSLINLKQSIRNS